MHHLWAWIMHATGSDDLSGPEYGFWSGFAGDLTVFAALAAYPWVAYRRHNCQVKRCWRIGRHELTDTDGVKRSLCHVHHPGVKRRQLNREDLHLYLGNRPGRG